MINLLKWLGNFATLPSDKTYGTPILAEEPHLINCIAEGGNLCICTCKDCTSKGKCICLECACHESVTKDEAT